LLGFGVSGFSGYKVLRSPEIKASAFTGLSFKVPRSQGFNIPRFQGFRVSKNHQGLSISSLSGFRVLGFQGFDVAGLRFWGFIGIKISGFQGFYVSIQGFKVSRSQRFRCFIALVEMLQLNTAILRLH
jgi:hypothetical protein